MSEPTGAIEDHNLHQHPYKSRQESLSHPEWATKHDNDPRARNLLQYILHPEKYADRVLRNSSNAVIIEDKYPKAQVHLLVLSKWHPHREMHPHDAFEDPDFRAMMRTEVRKGIELAIPLLKAKMFDSLKEDGLKSEEIGPLLSKRRFAKDFQVGIHAHPSQHEVHVHIISRDMISWNKYSARHYQSFNTPFLVPLKLLPLAMDDINRQVQYQNANLTKKDFECWRCSKNFGTDWVGMQQHLKEEWKAWIREDGDELEQAASLR